MKIFVVRAYQYSPHAPLSHRCIDLTEKCQSHWLCGTCGISVASPESLWLGEPAQFFGAYVDETFRSAVSGGSDKPHCAILVRAE